MKDETSTLSAFTEALAATLVGAMVWACYGAVTGAVYGVCTLFPAASLAFIMGGFFGGIGGVLAGVIHSVRGGWLGGAIAGLSGGAFAATLSLPLLGLPRYPSPAFWMLCVAPLVGMLVGLGLGRAADKRVSSVPLAAHLGDALSESPIERWSNTYRTVVALTIGIVAILVAIASITPASVD